MPISPGVLDDLLERSKNGEGDMETLLSKHVMGEISKAIKRKTEAMMDSCKLEEEFAKEVENKIEELSKPVVKMMGEEGQCGQTRGVMKPMEERDFSTLENLKMTNKAKEDDQLPKHGGAGGKPWKQENRQGNEVNKPDKGKEKVEGGFVNKKKSDGEYGRQNEKYVGGRGMTYRGRGGREGFRGGRGGTARRGLNPEARAYEPEGYETEKEEKKHENMSEGGQVDVDGDAEHEWDPGDEEEEETSRSVDSDVDFTAFVEESESEEEYERLNENSDSDCEPSFGLFEGDDFEEDTYIEHDGRFERASGHKGGWVGGRRERARDHYEFRYIF
nr:hypothetical protein Iba_chr14aCG3360 [Ipomoea batatas]